MKDNENFWLQNLRKIFERQKPRSEVPKNPIFFMHSYPFLYVSQKKLWWKMSVKYEIFGYDFSIGCVRRKFSDFLADTGFAHT